MRYWLFIATCMVVAGKAQSQVTTEITQFEYFFDEDPGYGNGTQVPVSDFIAAGGSIHRVFPVQVGSTLSDGLHRLFFRAKDEDGNWSQTTFQMFYKDRFLSDNSVEVAAMEYFIDNDPGYGNGYPIPGFTTGNSSITDLSFVLPVGTGLSDGLHKLFIRAKDSRNNWSQVGYRVFYKDPFLSNEAGGIAALEYFIDEDPGAGHAAMINPGAGTFADGFLFEVPASHLLADGSHTLFVRSKNSNGKWSILNSVPFNKEPGEELSLAQSGDRVAAGIPDNVLFDLVSAENRLMVTLKGKDLSVGPAQFSGEVAIHHAVQMINNQPVLQRYFKLAPGGTNPTSATITLYVTKSEMAAFNANSTVKLPEEPTDDKSALRVWQWHGDNPATGAPDEVIYPLAPDISWDVFLQAWKVTFSVTGFSTFYITAEGSTPLPVRLVDFLARKQENAALLSWQTAAESNSGRFDVEHTRDGSNWQKIGSIASAGQSDTLRSYRYVHHAPSAGINYYRLKMVDLDGTFGYSEIISLNFKTKAPDVSLYPNPARDRLTVSLSDPGDGYEIVNAFGQVVTRGKLNGRFTGQIPVRNLAAGVYHVRVQTGDGSWVVRKVVVE